MENKRKREFMENKRKRDGGYRRLQGGCSGDKQQRKDKSENE